jgi:hypothetical protein
VAQPHSNAATMRAPEGTGEIFIGVGNNTRGRGVLELRLIENVSLKD